jgi:gliding motility-associated lipoprotein GldH
MLFLQIKKAARRLPKRRACFIYICPPIRTIHFMKYLLLLLPLLFLLACGPNYVYEMQIEPTDGVWSYQDSLYAKFNIADTAAIYNLHLVLEHGTDFPYQNFYVRLHTRFPDGQRLSEQLSLELAAKGGVWLGDCDVNTCVLDIPIQEGAYFNQPGDYELTIEQFSRKELLPAVNKVVFRLEKTEEKRS